MFAALFVVIGCYLGWLSIRYAKSVNLVVSPTDPRPWVVPLKEFKTPTHLHLPVLGPNDVPESFTVEKPNATSVQFNFSSSRTSSIPLDDYGTRFHGDKDQIIQLPNGLKIKFIAFATTLPADVKELESRERKDYEWFDPVTLLPINSPETLGLEKTRYFSGKKHEFYTAFKIVSPPEQVDDSIRWHGATLRDARILTRLSSGSTYWTNPKEVQVFRHERQFFHNTPVDISFSVSYGMKESIEVDLQDAPLNKSIYFPSREAAITPLYRDKGDINSWGFGGEYQSFSWSNTEQKSFVLLQTSPRSAANQIQIILPDKSKTGINKEIDSLSLKNEAQKANYKFQLLSNVAHCQFQISEIPQLPECENLLTVPMGSVNLKQYDFTEAIERAAGLKFTHHSSSDLKVTSFPFYMEDATPQKLLEEMERNTPIVIDTKTFEVTRPPTSVSWWQRIEDFLRL